MSHEPWDLIIVGAGTCGLTAAVFGGQRGGRILLLDAAPEVGGSLLVAHGQISAAGTKRQKERGIVDTPELHYEDVIRISKGTIDKDLARLAIFNAAPTFDWLVDHGYDLVPQCPVTSDAHEPYSVARYYWGNSWGRSIARVLEQEMRKEVARGTVTLRTNTQLVDLLRDPDGSVRGVLASTDGAPAAPIAGRNVLLACGGYAANPDYFEELCGVPLYARAAYRFNLGIGHKVAVAAGGYLRGRDKYLCNFGWILSDDKFPSPITGRANTYPASRAPWEIYVNANAERFIREDEPSVDVREHALLKQPHKRYWIVFDQAIFDATPPIVFDWTREQMAEAFGAHPMFLKADSIAALAQRCGLDSAALENTVKAYNAAQASGHDPLGRKHMPAPIAKGPFYAIRNQGASVTSTLGIAVDGELRVIRRDGSAIPNLYAAGEILGGGQLQGDAFVGGMMAMPALVFGRLLGERLIPFGRTASSASAA